MRSSSHDTIQTCIPFEPCSYGSPRKVAGQYLSLGAMPRSFPGIRESGEEHYHSTVPEPLPASLLWRGRKLCSVGWLCGFFENNIPIALLVPYTDYFRVSDLIQFQSRLHSFPSDLAGSSSRWFCGKRTLAFSSSARYILYPTGDPVLLSVVPGDSVINMPSAGVCLRTLRAYSKYGSNVRRISKRKPPEAPRSP